VQSAAHCQVVASSSSATHLYGYMGQQMAACGTLMRDGRSGEVHASTRMRKAICQGAKRRTNFANYCSEKWNLDAGRPRRRMGGTISLARSLQTAPETVHRVGAGTSASMLTQVPDLTSTHLAAVRMCGRPWRSVQWCLHVRHCQYSTLSCVNRSLTECALRTAVQRLHGGGVRGIRGETIAIPQVRGAEA
jgi:hypothetical protein